MIPRAASTTLTRLLGWYPVVVVTGPRQAGKTTLCRSVLPTRPYVDLESELERSLWATDPVRSLRHHPEGAILDEAQRLPARMSWLQVEADRDLAPPGRGSSPGRRTCPWWLRLRSPSRGGLAT